jgi:hypothetical protein
MMDRGRGDGAASRTNMNLSPHDIHHGILLPAFLAVVFLLPALIPKLRRRAHIPLLVALTVAFILPYLHLFGRPPLPPTESIQWLFYLPFAVFPIALIIDLTNLRSLSLPLLVLSTTLILWPILRNGNSFAESITIISFITLASFLSYLSLTRLSPRMGNPSTHLILLLIIAATSQILLMSGSRTLGQTSLIVTAALLGSLPLAWCLKFPPTPGPLLLVLLLWHSLLICGHFLASLTPLNALLLIIAPHLAWIAEGARPRHWPKPARIILRFAAVLIPMLIAQSLALRDFLEATREMQL